MKKIPDGIAEKDHKSHVDIFPWQRIFHENARFSDEDAVAPRRPSPSGHQKKHWALRITFQLCKSLRFCETLDRKTRSRRYYQKIPTLSQRNIPTIRPNDITTIFQGFCLSHFPPEAWSSEPPTACQPTSEKAEQGKTEPVHVSKPLGVRFGIA